MPILLWPDGAPFAKGKESEDIPKLFHFPAASQKETAAVIINPGGGYEDCNTENEGQEIAPWINSLGMTAFVLQYRVKPYQHPCPLLDAQRAVRYIRHHSKKYNIDPNRIAMLGFSAGGHLACTTATHSDEGDPKAADPIDRESSKLNLLMMGYGSTSFMKREYTVASQLNLIGENPSEELKRYYSNEFHVTEHTPRTFMWHTSNDRVQNSLIFALALKEKKIRFEYHCYEYGSHGMGLARDHYAGSWTEHAAAWLKRNEFI